MTEGYSHIVIGAGAIGSAAAYWLAEAGAEKVLVVEQFGLLPTLGASGDHSRIIRHAYHSPTYTALTRAMFAAWQEVEQRCGLPLYRRTGGLDLARAGGPGAADIAAYRAALDAADLPYDDLDVAQIRESYPQWRLEDDVIGLYQEAGGLLDIRRSVSAHTSMALAAGVEFRPHTVVTGIEVGPRSVTVVTSGGTVTADHLVVAAGSWTPDLMADLDLSFRLTLSQEQVSYLSSATLGDFTPERFPVWLFHGDQAGEFYGFPVYGEAGVKVGRDLAGEVIESKDRRFEGTDEEAQLLREFMARRLPGAAGPVLSSRTCVYDLPADRDFVLDTLPGSPHVAVFVGAGHAGKFASLVGQILAALTTAGETQHPIAPFRLDRPALTDPAFVPVFA